MTINYTDANVKNGQLTVSTGGQPFTVNVDIPVNVTIKNAGDGMINFSGSGTHTVQLHSNSNLTIHGGTGTDNIFIAKQVGAVHVDVTGGPGNDVFNNASSKALVNYEYNFTQGRSSDGADGIFNFVAGQDHLVLNGVTETQFMQNFTVTNALGSVGAVITDGTNDGWSVQLIGVHATEAQLLAQGAFVFA